VTDDIVAFIRARLGQDEQAARAAGAQRWDASGWTFATSPDEVATGDERVVVGSVDDDRGDGNLAAVEHIARHDPARVLREVEAKRALLAWVQDRLHDAEDFPADEEYRLKAIQALRIHLPLLAAPYSDHPAFREEWALPNS
jgi:hypothetical protein